MGNQILLLKRAEVISYMPGFWDVPGGDVEVGESLEEALEREVFEETALRVELGPIMCAYTNNAQLPSRRTFQVVYWCRFLSGDIKLRECEHQDFAWVTLDKAGEYECMPFLNFALKAAHNAGSGYLR
jgi:8-oxo-dGTP diphosphatase